MLMKRRWVCLAVLGLAMCPGIWLFARDDAPKKPEPGDRFAADVAPFVAKHCFTCHGNGKNKGEVALDKDHTEQDLLEDRDLWESVVQMVQAGKMPPKKQPRPGPEEIKAAVGSIEAVLASFDCTGPREPGRVTLHRLNRAEYNNTIRDLLGVDFQPAVDFPDDDVGYGFDNIGDVLTISPLLLEKYLTAAESVLDEAIVAVEPPQPQENRLGGVRVSRGAGEAQRGLSFLHSKGQIFGQNFFEEGDYTIKVEAYGQQSGDEPVKAVLRVRGDDIKAFDVTGDRENPTKIEAKLRLKNGTTTIAVAFLNPTRKPPPEEGEAANNDMDKDKDKEKADEPDPEHERRLYVRRIVLDGPYNAPPPKLPESQKRLMGHKEGLAPREAAREIITRFATKAFRRPVRREEVESILKMYDLAEKEGEAFEGRLRLALDRVLVSPHFLFRVEFDPPGAEVGKAYPVNEYELASRLSYFFWSTMPDDELSTLAAKGELRKNLNSQVKRMLRDKKSDAFVKNFAGQWLTLRKLANIAPDPELFPSFDNDLRTSMERETELFFEDIVREDRSVLQFIDADYSFLNERLAKHYGIDDVKGKEFRKVKLPANRGGLLTQASILTLTSNPTRTSPVKRGKWVLDQLLNQPPPPPPPDVPNLPETKELKGSLRQVMEQHRSNAICASCHERMDPIGFAFENYDAVGAWRDKDGKFDIDPAGVLPDGQAFKGPAELKTILKSKKDLFCRCLSEKLLTYALGRGLEYYDKCAVDKLLEALEQNDYRFSALLIAVTESEPFQMRTASGAKP